jgi:hypothetical protein
MSLIIPLLEVIRAFNYYPRPRSSIRGQRETSLHEEWLWWIMLFLSFSSTESWPTMQGIRSFSLHRAQLKLVLKQSNSSCWIIWTLGWDSSRVYTFSRSISKSSYLITTQATPLIQLTRTVQTELSSCWLSTTYLWTLFILQTFPKYMEVETNLWLKTLARFSSILI